MTQNLPFYFVPVDTVGGKACIGVQLVLAPWPRGRLSVILKEEDIVKVISWCVDNNCGNRTSYDTWVFKTEADRTHFMLRWG